MNKRPVLQSILIGFIFSLVASFVLALFKNWLITQLLGPVNVAELKYGSNPYIIANVIGLICLILVNLAGAAMAVTWYKRKVKSEQLTPPQP